LAEASGVAAPTATSAASLPLSGGAGAGGFAAWWGSLVAGGAFEDSLDVDVVGVDVADGVEGSGASLLGSGALEGASLLDPPLDPDFRDTSPLPTELPCRTDPAPPPEEPVPGLCEVHPLEGGAVAGGEVVSGAGGCVEPPGVSVPVSPGGEPPDPSSAASAPAGGPAARTNTAAIIESSKRRRCSFLISSIGPGWFN